MEDIFRLSRRIKFVSLVRKLFVIFLVSTLVLLLSAIQSITQLPIQSFGQPCDPTIQSCPEPPPMSGCDPTVQSCPEPPTSGCDPTVQSCPETPPSPSLPEPPCTTFEPPYDCPRPPVSKLFNSSKYLCDPNSEQLKVGSKGDKVIELQTYLTDLGYGAALQPEGIDGKFGPHTKNSVMQYQQERMLPSAELPGDKRIDGIVGPKTWNSICIDAALWLENSYNPYTRSNQ